MNKMIEAAVAAIKAGEEKGLSERTMNKKWRAYFMAVEAAKASGAWL